MRALPSLEQVIAQYGLATKKSLGQHFLLDDAWLNKITAAAGDLRDVHVLEIGPGPGGLTRSILAQPVASLTALEKDARCVHALASLVDAADGKLVVKEVDALAEDITTLTSAPRAILANLPYNVGTAMMVQWLQQLAQQGTTAWQSLTVMLQKEVAERFVASPRSPAYGRLSILMQWLCHARIHFDVPPEAFAPPPKVVSSVLHAVPRAQPLAPANALSLEKVVAAAFNQRRKMLRSSLKALAVPTDALCDAAGIDATLRAEALEVEQFCALANAYDLLQSTSTNPSR